VATTVQTRPPQQGPRDWFACGVAAYQKQRYLKALEAWKRASAQGDTESYYRIGLLYARGEGVVPSLPDAVTWYRRAAEAGHTEAQYQLGLIYLNGSKGGVGDHWLKAASLQNSEAAQRTLNMLFPNGISVGRDLGEAKRWIWAAAVAGKVEAQAVLGELYRSGRPLAIPSGPYNRCGQGAVCRLVRRKVT
jgi:TPR repeat protein